MNTNENNQAEGEDLGPVLDLFGRIENNQVTISGPIFSTETNRIYKGPIIVNVSESPISNQNGMPVYQCDIASGYGEGNSRMPQEGEFMLEVISENNDLYFLPYGLDDTEKTPRGTIIVGGGGG